MDKKKSTNGKKEENLYKLGRTENNADGKGVEDIKEMEHSGHGGMWLLCMLELFTFIIRHHNEGKV